MRGLDKKMTVTKEDTEKVWHWFNNLTVEKKAIVCFFLTVLLGLLSFACYMQLPRPVELEYSALERIFSYLLLACVFFAWVTSLMSAYYLGKITK